MTPEDREWIARLVRSEIRGVLTALAAAAVREDSYESDMVETAYLYVLERACKSAEHAMTEHRLGCPARLHRYLDGCDGQCPKEDDR